MNAKAIYFPGDSTRVSWVEVSERVVTELHKEGYTLFASGPCGDGFIVIMMPPAAPAPVAEKEAPKAEGSPVQPPSVPVPAVPPPQTTLPDPPRPQPHDPPVHPAHPITPAAPQSAPAANAGNAPHPVHEEHPGQGQDKDKGKK